jgi:hypothetical protein
MGWGLPQNMVLHERERRFKLIDLGACADLRTGANFSPDEVRSRAPTHPRPIRTAQLTASIVGAHTRPYGCTAPKPSCCAANHAPRTQDGGAPSGSRGSSQVHQGDVARAQVNTC